MLALVCQPSFITPVIAGQEMSSMTRAMQHYKLYNLILLEDFSFIQIFHGINMLTIETKYSSLSHKMRSL